MPKYNIFLRGIKVGVMKQKFTLLNPKFIINMFPGFGPDLEARGDFMAYDFAIRRGDRIVATVSKKWFTYADVYGVEVLPGEDAALILQIAVIMDKCLHENNNNGVIGGNVTVVEPIRHHHHGGFGLGFGGVFKF